MAHVYRNKPERDDTIWLNTPHHLAAITPVSLPCATHAAAPAQVMWADEAPFPNNRSAWWQTWLPLGADAPCLHVLPEVIAEMTSVNEYVIMPDSIGDYHPSPVTYRQLKGDAMPMSHMQRLLTATCAMQSSLNDHIHSRDVNIPLATVIAQALTLMQEAFAFTAVQCWLAPTAQRATDEVIQGKGAPISVATTQTLSDLAQQAHREQRWCQSRSAGVTLMALPLGQGMARYGALVCARLSEQPLRDDEMGMVEMIALQLTGALTAEEELLAARASEQFWNTVLDSQPDGFILYDKYHNILKYSQAALDLAVNRAEVIAARETNQPIIPIWNTRWTNESEITAADAPSTRAIMTGTQTYATQLWVCPDLAKPQTKIPVLVSAAPIVDASTSIQGAVVRFQDITSMKGVETLKQQLVRRIQHDIRSPMSEVLVKAQLIDKYVGRLPLAKIREYANCIEESTERISAKVDNLTNLDNAVWDPPVRMSLVDRVKAYLHAQRKLYGSQRIQWEIDAADSALEGSWSPREIDSIIDNLVQNALKYSPADTPIIVRLYPTEHYSKRMAHMAVIDQGYGVPAVDKSRIFEDAYRSITQTPDGRDIPGTGMGLNFCYMAVTMHEGKIWVESAGLGRGSTFHVELPLAR